MVKKHHIRRTKKFKVTAVFSILKVNYLYIHKDEYIQPDAPTEPRSYALVLPAKIKWSNLPSIKTSYAKLCLKGNAPFFKPISLLNRKLETGAKSLKTILKI